MKEFDYPTFNFNNRTKRAGRIIKDTGSPLYCHSRDLWVRAKTSISQKPEHQSIMETKKSLEELIPEQYRKFQKVFEKAASERFPDERPWDHAIDIKPDFVPKDCKVYPLTPTKQSKLDGFLDENLKKGYIRQSKSPMASPFFFVAKKDKDALWPTQDYQYLNENTVKNTYPLPLVSDLLD